MPSAAPRSRHAQEPRRPACQVPRQGHRAGGSLTLSAVRIPAWTWIAPLAGCVALLGAGRGGAFVFVLALALAGCVLAAVHHAEVIAHKVGEPFGSLVLALAVTVIEVALIVSLM